MRKTGRLRLSTDGHSILFVARCSRIARPMHSDSPSMRSIELMVMPGRHKPHTARRLK